jgi:hypothetical protein
MAQNRSTLPVTARMALAGATVLLTLPACAGSSGKTVPSTTSAASTTPLRTSTSTAPAKEEQQVVAAVRAFWDLYLELGANSGPFNASETRARLATRTIGEELDKLFDVFQGNAAAGYVVRGTIDISPTVLSVNAASAKVRDCYDDKTGLYRATDGTRLDKPDARRHKVLMTLVRVRGTWKVSAIAEEGLGCVV